VLALAACTFTGGDNPVQRKFSWFDYVDGGDIRRSCGPGAPERYRFVYNGIYIEQVRTYDLVAEGDGAFMRVRVLGPASVSQWTATAAGDLLAPWRGTTKTARLSPRKAEQLRRAMAGDGVFDGAPKGLELSSDGFYWTVAACHDGGFHFNAYRWPSDRYEAAAFPVLLAAWDPTDIPVNPPRKVTSEEIHRYRGPTDVDEPRLQFTLRVGDNGLWGVKPLF
jgi:hypothetical protein